MTSEERKEARYRRRVARRAEKKRARLAAAAQFDSVASYSALYAAAKRSRRGVYWKDSTRRYHAALFLNLARTHKALEAGKSIHRETTHFTVIERGKPRSITSHKYSERVVQTAICRGSMVPVLTNGLIYDNGASQEGKGIDFAADRLEAHLHRYFRRHHTNRGFVLLMDQHNYFGSIRKDEAIKQIRADYATLAADPEEVGKLLRLILQEVEPEGAVGIGLGSPLNQTIAVRYCNRADHWAKEAGGVEATIVYMDDRAYIDESKEKLQRVLEMHRQINAALGLELNEKKTCIVPLNKPFRFLKTRFLLTETGAVIRLKSRENTTTMRRKLKKFAKKAKEGKMTGEQIRGPYLSWRAFMERKDAWHTIRAMDGLYNRLFVLTHITKPLPKHRKGKQKWLPKTQKPQRPPLPPSAPPASSCPPWV